MRHKGLDLSSPSIFPAYEGRSSVLDPCSPLFGFPWSSGDEMQSGSHGRVGSRSRGPSSPLMMWEMPRLWLVAKYGH